MTTEQSLKAYEVNFVTEALQHAFYISCAGSADSNTFAHAVFHYYDMPAEWGRKSGITNIAEIEIEDCIPEYLHMIMQSKTEIAMPDESEASHRTVKKTIKQVMDDGGIPMAIYDQEKKIMTVYSTRKMEATPRAGASGNVLNFE